MAKKKGKGGNWIAGAVKRPGALTSKAKKAGKSVQSFAKANADAPGLTGKQARLALLFNKFRKGGKKKR